MLDKREKAIRAIERIIDAAQELSEVLAEVRKGARQRRRRASGTRLPNRQEGVGK
jgi:hypothetical protein